MSSTENEAPQSARDSWQSRLRSQRGLLTLVILTVVALAVAGYMVKTDKEEAAPPAPVERLAPLQTAQVAITASGFNPATISVKAGTQLVWTNNDSKARQLAADPHPLHDGIEGFDSDQPLQPGDAFSFVFEKAGTYQYHDELNPLTVLGTVIVE